MAERVTERECGRKRVTERECDRKRVVQKECGRKRDKTNQHLNNALLA